MASLSLTATLFSYKLLIPLAESLLVIYSLIRTRPEINNNLGGLKIFQKTY